MAYSLPNKIGYLMLVWVCSACATGAIARTPECNAKVNRCMEQCGNTASSQEPRNQVLGTGPTVASTPSYSCEQSCNTC